jgi:hypothetical protein
MSGFGGFFPIEQPAPVRDSVLAAWTSGLEWCALTNARSALVAALRMANVRHLWIPSYICRSVEQSAAQICKIRCYPLDESCRPDVEFLRQHLQAGDGCLVFRVFGTDPGQGCQDLQNDREDVVWIEDCAHALAPPPLQTGFRYYSPRKLVGVPEGGILVWSKSLILHNEEVLQEKSESVVPVPLAAFLRAMDPDSGRVAWYGEYQSSEARQSISMLRTSDYVLRLLDSLSIGALRAARVRNHARLLAALPSEWVFKIVVDCPFGLILDVDDAAAAVRALQCRGLFAQRHWADVAGTGELDRRLAKRLLTLPVDHRLSDRDVDQIAAIVLDVIPGINR